MAAPGTGPPVAAPVSDPPGSVEPLLPGNCRSGPGGGGAHPGSRGRGPAPGPGGAPPEPGGGPRLAFCPGGVGGFRHGGFRPGLGRDQAPPEAGRGSGPPQATPPGPGAGPGRAQGLAGLRTGRPAPQLPGGLKIPVLLPPGGPVAEAAGSRPGRHPGVSPGKPLRARRRPCTWRRPSAPSAAGAWIS